MIRALALILAWASPALAETALVRSGEHGGFTRLVIELPGGGGWTVGRTDAGYAFAAEAEVQPDYDLSRVWELITRSRLSDLRRAPESGALELVLGCDCHVFPFETQPGVVVLDIKPGPPPPASSFEDRFVPPGAKPEPAEPERRYDWLAIREGSGEGPTSGPHPLRMPLPLHTGEVSLEPLREELLEQIARGAADGIVEMKLPGKPREVPEADHAELPWSNIHIGEAPGVAVTDPDAFVEGALAEGACIDSELLDLPSWGGEGSAADLLAASRSGLYGEFDAPELDAIRRSAQQLLYLGFGAEARQTVELAESGGPDEFGYYRSMGLILDGEDDPTTPFADMLDCDGPAALWAALARDQLPPGPGVRSAAIVQAFVALPAHLRRHLGLRLAEKFLERDDAESARIIRNAMERAPEADPLSVELLDAKTDLHLGDPAAAQAHAEAAVNLDGDGPEGLVTLVETHFRTLEPLAPETAEALRALQREAAGTEAGPEIDRAIVLALALSNQIPAAFEEAASAGPDTVADLWRVTEDRATDDAFLMNAVLAEDAQVPVVDPDVGLAIAERLLDLGFPDAAKAWLGPVFPEDSPERRRLAAKAAFLQGDSRATVGYLDGMSDAEAEGLRAEALMRLGDLDAAERALTAAGEAEAAVRISPWKEDWEKLDPSLAEPWLEAARVATAPEEAFDGPLGRGARALDASVEARTAIDQLLSSIASPKAE